MRIVILALLSGLSGLRFLAKPGQVLLIALGIFIAIPASASALLTGRDYGVSGPSSLLPVTIIVCGAALVIALLLPEIVFRLSLPVPQTVGLSLVLGVSMACTLVRGGGSGIGQFLDSLAGPIILFLLILIGKHIDPSLGSNLRILLVTMSVSEASLGIIQYLLKRPVLFERNYARQPWFKFMKLTGFRSMGTFDHPLTFALFLLLALCLTLSLGNRTVSIATSATLLLAIAATGSRSAFIAGIFVMLLLALTPPLRARGVILSVGLVAASLLIFSPLGTVLASRLSNDSGSSAARRQAADLFVQILPSHIAAGSGIGSSGRVAAGGGLRTSFESPLFILSIEIGLAMTLLLLVIMASLALNRHGGKGWGPENYGALSVLVVAMTYSSFGVKSEAGYVVWIALALAVTLPSANSQSNRELGISAMRTSKHSAQL